MISPACFSRPVNAFTLLAFCAVAGVVQGAAPAYPSRPIRLLVPFATGGSGDLLARIIAPKLSDAMGQNWIVDNRSGAAGNLGADIVVHSNPDGYTVLMALSQQLTANPSLYKLSFNVERDLQPIAMLATAEQIVVVHPSVSARTLKEFIALAKQKPGALTYASAGVGSSLHLGAELLKRRAAIDMLHVPFKGGGPAAASVLGGETQVMVGSVASTIAYITAGRMRALATTGLKRSKLISELPTVAESGYPGFELIVWNGLLVPSATPKIIAERIRKETLNAMQQTDVPSALARLGLDPETSTSAELAARIKTETTMWAGVIRDAGIRGE